MISIVRFFGILLFISNVFAQSCSTFETANYLCGVDHPGHTIHGAVIFISGDYFEYTSRRSLESCRVNGTYTVDGDSIILTSAESPNLACIVDTNAKITTLEWENCVYQPACDGFACYSDANPEGVTSFNCDIDYPTVSNPSPTSKNDSSDSSILRVTNFALIISIILNTLI